jgi:hypothetical protein
MRSWKARVVLVLLSLVVAFVGYVAWSIEDEYGSGTNFAVEHPQDGTTVIVYDVDEQNGQTKVFEGSMQEAEAYMEQRRAEGESFVVPGLILALGAVLLIVALLPSRRAKGGT